MDLDSQLFEPQNTTIPSSTLIGNTIDSSSDDHGGDNYNVDSSIEFGNYESEQFGFFSQLLIGSNNSDHIDEFNSNHDDNDFDDITDTINNTTNDKSSIASRVNFKQLKRKSI
jgi:hypothetical protein